MKLKNKRLVLTCGTVGSVIAVIITWIFGDSFGGTWGLISFIASIISLAYFGVSLSRVNKAPTQRAGIMFPETAPVVSFEDGGAIIRFEFWNREGSRVVSNNDRGKACDLGKAEKRTVIVGGKAYLADVIDGDRGVGVKIELNGGPRDIKRFVRFQDGTELMIDEGKVKPEDNAALLKAAKEGRIEIITVDKGPLTRLLLDITNTAEEAWAFLESLKHARTYTEDLTGRSKVMFMAIGFIIAILVRLIFRI